MGEETGASSAGGNFISKKMGPLPLWAWVVVGAGVIGGYLILTKRRSGTPTVGQQANAPGSSGVGQADPLTADMLLQAMQSLTNQLQQGSMPPGSTGATSALGWVIAQGAQTGIFADPSSNNTVSWVPGGTPLQIAGPPVQGLFPFGATDGYWHQSNWWLPVIWEGQKFFIWEPFGLPSNTGPDGSSMLAINSGTQGGGFNLARTSTPLPGVTPRLK